MPRKPNNIHYIYKTTNLINKKFYIGMHSTSNINDGYLGSGLILRRSIRKYGEKNFKREILEYCDSREMLAKREEAIVTQKLINNRLCMNLQLGGIGGFTNKQQKLNSIKGVQKMNDLRKNKEWFDNVNKKVSNTLKEHYKNGIRVKPKELSFKNIKHTIETKNKISNSHRGKGLKELNSQYGTMWITNGKQNKKIKQTDIIPNGYYKGRLK